MRLNFSLGKKTLIGVALGLVSAALVLLVTRIMMPNVAERFEAETLDSRYVAKINYQEAQRQGAKIEDIVIVDIDTRSIQRLGRYSQWPRSYHARMVETLRASGARSICFDVLFLDKDKNPQVDSLLVNSIRRAGNVVNALAFSTADQDFFLYPMEAPPEKFDAKRFVLNVPADIAEKFHHEDRFEGEFYELYNNSASLGFVNFLSGQDDTIRRIPLFLNFAGQVYPSFALAAIMQYAGYSSADLRIDPENRVVVCRSPTTRQLVRIPIDEQGRMLINYEGEYQTFRYVSYYDVLNQRLPPEFFTNKIVLIGTSSAPGLFDLRVVPFRNDFPGVEVHANVIHNILTKNFIIEQPAITGLAILLIAGVVIAVFSILLRPWLSILLTLASAGGYGWLVFWAFVYRSVLMSLVAPLLVMALAFLIVMVYRYVSEEREKKFIWSIFGNYLSGSLVREMLRNPAMLKLGGERKYATAFFSDIKDFTTVSEQLSPEKLIKQLNEYLSAMTEIVLDYGGYLDKYEGDAVVAFFGIPVDQDDHALRASLAALDMQASLTALRTKWQQQSRPLLQARIGINSGFMIAGNIGGRKRFDYTAIGDSVNLAARLEGVNKMYGTNIITGESTYDLVKNAVIARELDFVRVKGKKKPVRIYELLGRRDRGIGQEYAAIFTHFARGLELYRRQEWKKAIAEFRRVLELKKNDGPATEMLRRCEVFLQSPRPEGWDGVFEMHVK